MPCSELWCWQQRTPLLLVKAIIGRLQVRHEWDQSEVWLRKVLQQCLATCLTPFYHTGGQHKRFKDSLKVSLKKSYDSWEELAQECTAWQQRLQGSQSKVCRCVKKKTHNPQDEGSLHLNIPHQTQVPNLRGYFHTRISQNKPCVDSQKTIIYIIWCHGLFRLRQTNIITTSSS